MNGRINYQNIFKIWLKNEIFYNYIREDNCYVNQYAYSIFYYFIFSFKEQIFLNHHWSNYLLWGIKKFSVIDKYMCEYFNN